MLYDAWGVLLRQVQRVTVFLIDELHRFFLVELFSLKLSLSRWHNSDEFEFMRLVDAQFSDFVDDILLIVGIEETLNVVAALVRFLDFRCLPFGS